MTVLLALLGNRFFSGGLLFLVVLSGIVVASQRAHILVLKHEVASRDDTIVERTTERNTAINSLTTCRDNVDALQKTIERQNDRVKGAHEEWLKAQGEAQALRDQLSKKPAVVQVVRTVIEKQPHPPSTCEDAMPAVDALIRSLH